MKRGFNLEELEKNNAHSIQGKHGLCLTTVFISWQANKGLICLHGLFTFPSHQGPSFSQ